MIGDPDGASGARFMTNVPRISQRLGLTSDFDSLLEALVDWCAPDPQPVFDLVWSAECLPGRLQKGGHELLRATPEEYHRGVERFFAPNYSKTEESKWRALGLLLDDARCLRFRDILTGDRPDPLSAVYQSAKVQPDDEGLLVKHALAGSPMALCIGSFDVEVSRSIPRAANSTYWLVPTILGRASCRVRLDPLRIATRGTLPRMRYAMIVFGPPFRWERILRLQAVEAVRWFEGEGNHVIQDVVTELVWKPRVDEIVLEVEQLPAPSEVLTKGARYLHAVLNRRERHFVHLDGAIRWYSRTDLTARSDTRLDKSGAVGTRTKIFRLDEPLELAQVLDILCAFFVWNYDLAAYFDPNAPTARMSHNTAVVLSGDED